MIERNHVEAIRSSSSNLFFKKAPEGMVCDELHSLPESSWIDGKHGGRRKAREC
jgi:hypothetical protein